MGEGILKGIPLLGRKAFIPESQITLMKPLDLENPSQPKVKIGLETHVQSALFSKKG